MSDNNPMEIFKNIKDIPDMQPAYLWKLKFELLDENSNYGKSELFDMLSLHVKEFVEEKTIIFNEYQDFAVTQAFDDLEFDEKRGFAKPHKYKVILEFYNRNCNKVTFSRIYYVKLKRRPLTLTYTTDKTMTVVVDMIPTSAPTN